MSKSLCTASVFVALLGVLSAMCVVVPVSLLGELSLILAVSFCGFIVVVAVLWLLFLCWCLADCICAGLRKRFGRKP